EPHVRAAQPRRAGGAAPVRVRGHRVDRSQGSRRPASAAPARAGRADPVPVHAQFAQPGTARTAIRRRTMDAYSLMYHDLIGASTAVESGFDSADAASYKLDAGMFDRHLYAITRAVMRAGCERVA